MSTTHDAIAEAELVCIASVLFSWNEVAFPALMLAGTRFVSDDLGRLYDALVAARLDDGEASVMGIRASGHLSSDDLATLDRALAALEHQDWELGQDLFEAASDELIRGGARL